MKKRFIRLRDGFLSLPLFDRIFDTAVFIGMIVVTVLQILTKDEPFKVLQLCLNIAASLTFFLSHLLFSERSLPGSISLRCQKYIDIIVLFGSIGGQYLILGDYYSNYDTATHLVTGCVVCLIGVSVFEHYIKEPAFKKPTLCALFSFFMSMTVSLMWEIFEFVSDFFFGGTCQGYDLPADSSKFFYFHWFSFAPRPEAQHGLYDTFADVIAGMLTAALTSFIIAKVLQKKKRKDADLSMRTEYSHA